MKTDLPEIRGVWRFLLISAGLHLILLLGMNAEYRTLSAGPATVSLEAVLSSAKQRAEVPPGAKAEKPFKRPAARANLLDAATARRTAPVLAETETPSAGGEPTPPQAKPAEIAGSAGAAKPAVPTSQSPAGANVDAIRQYVLLLVPEARRLKRYPAQARARGWEGTVEITVKLDPASPGPIIVLTRSSGFPVLDEQAAAMIRQAVLSIPVPESLRGKDVAIPVPVQFNLEN